MSTLETSMDAYLKRPYHCPFCQSQNITSDGMSIVEDNCASSTVSCLDCDNEWRDVYTLSEVEWEHEGKRFTTNHMETEEI